MLGMRKTVILLIICTMWHLFATMPVHAQQSATNPKKTKYTFTVVARRAAGQDAVLDGVHVHSFEDYSRSIAVLTDSGNIIYFADTDKGEALFEDTHVLAYGGKSFSGISEYAGGSYQPSLDAFNATGGVLYTIWYRDGASIRNLYVAGGSPVCVPQYGDAYSSVSSSPLPPTITGFNGFCSDGFTNDGYSAVLVEVTTWSQRKDEDGHYVYDSDGKPFYDPSTNPQWLVGGVLQLSAPDGATNSNAPVYYQQVVDAQKGPALTGISLVDLYKTVFGELLPDAAGGVDCVDFPILIRQNHKGQLAFILTAHLLSSPAHDYAQAVVLATPANAPPISTPVFFSKVLTGGFKSDIQNTTNPGDTAR